MDSTQFLMQEGWIVRSGLLFFRDVQITGVGDGEA